ncbi:MULTISPECIES: efflux RND transporter permease subunit [unclassified Bradyrhizobium]|uniref:efflux RND transporter permease subunit n=1 Tax=unclassified Bradyrhizobium TaxID=2631580 RepID=UPI0028E482D9|nr:MULTISPECIES: efflux RND transporter permease subunit [unclassified Bradyrhizobium]
MRIDRFSLRRPQTLYVLAELILFLGGIAVCSMSTDIFPEIRMPVVTVVWSDAGLPTPEMEPRVRGWLEEWRLSTERPFFLPSVRQKAPKP